MKYIIRGKKVKVTDDLKEHTEKSFQSSINTLMREKTLLRPSLLER